MRNIVLTIALVGALGLMVGCSGLGGNACSPCEPDPCCDPVYVSPCCPAPSQGMGYTPGAGGAAAPADGGAACGACGGGKACG